MALHASNFRGVKTGLNPIGALPGGVVPSVPTSLPTTLPGVPTLPTGDGGLGAALAAAAQGAQDQAAAAVQGGVSAAAQTANAAAMAYAGKLGLAPAVVAVENGDYATAAEDAALVALSHVQLPPAFAQGLQLIQADSAQVSATIASVIQAISMALPMIASLLGTAAAEAVANTLAAIASTIGATSIAASEVPIVGTAIGAIVGAFVAIGQEISAAFPCGNQTLTFQQYWRFADLGTLHAGENCGALEAVAGKGSASGDLQSARLSSLEEVINACIAEIKKTPNWQSAFLAIYTHLRAGDATGPALYVWAPTNGYEHFLADEVFKRLGDEFADWWIQQPGWLSALGGLPVIPVYVSQIWTSDSAGGHLPLTALVDLQAAYQAYANAHGGQWAQPDPRTSDGPMNGLIGSKPLPVSLELNVPDHGQVASNLPAMLAAHIPGAIGRAIIRHNALIPSNANASAFALAMIGAAQAADSVGSKAVSDYVSAHIRQVAPKIGTVPMHPAGLPWLTIDAPVYGLPGDPLPQGATPVNPPQYANADGSGGGAPLPANLIGQAPAPKPFSGLGSGIAKLHTSSAGTAAGTASGTIAVAPGTWTAPKLPTSPVNTGLAVLTLSQKVAVQAQFVAKWFGAQAGADIAASYHLTPAQAVMPPLATAARAPVSMLRARTAGIPVLPNPPCDCAKGTR